MSGSEKVAKTERLLNLIALLLKSRRPVPFIDIAGQVIGYNDDARLDSIEKRFDRDKAELRNMGIPVEYVDTGDSDTSGYVIPKDRFFLGKIELDSEDAILLAMAARAARVTHTSPVMKESFASAMRKLSIDLPPLEDIPFEAAPVMQISSGNAKASTILQSISAAVYAKKTITFDYAAVTSSKPPERRVVDPYGLGISRGEWYFVGRCHARRAVRMFKLTRVLGTVGLVGPSDSVNEFEIPHGFKITDHLRRESWDFGESAPEKVRVRVPEALGRQLVESSSIRWEAEEKKAPGGETIIATEARDPERLVDWLFSLGHEVRIIEPKAVVDIAKKRLAALEALYTGDRGEGRTT